MLVLTRRTNESLVINDTIIVTILAVEGDKVKIGIVAPKEIPILRQELYQALKDQSIIEARLSSGPEPESLKSLRDLLSEEFGENEKEQKPEEPGEKP